MVHGCAWCPMVSVPFGAAWAWGVGLSLGDWMRSDHRSVSDGTKVTSVSPKVVAPSLHKFERNRQCP